MGNANRPPPEFRREAVPLALTVGQTRREIAEDLGIGLSTLTRWLGQERDASEPSEASVDLGAKPWQTFLKVIFPMTLPGVVAGSVIVFIPAVGNFIVPNILGGAKGLMTGNLIEQQFLSSRNWPFGSALAMVVMAVVLGALTIFATRAKKGGGAA